jgi:hypothetical protein
MNQWLTLFRAAMVIGVLADWAVYLPGMFDPSGALVRLGFPPPGDDGRWVAFASWLAVLVSWFYLPGGLLPYRYPAGAWLAVLGRALVGTVVLAWTREYALLGWVQLGLFAVQLPLLVLARRARPRPEEGVGR